jgi:expansin (peptidoglycan-binding protein)
MSWGALRAVAFVGAAGFIATAVTAVGEGAGASTDEVVPGAGMATHYDSDGTGNCSMPALPGEHLDVALSESEYGMADSCGGWLDVTGPNGSVRVVITNRCPECQQGHLDLSKEAFARIAPLEAGQVDVSYSLVRDPPLSGPMSMRVKSGSSQWWMQIQAVNHGNPIASFELQQDGGWRSLVHSQDNFWTAEDPGPGVGPYTVRITDIYGQSATVDGITMSPDALQPTNARLYGGGSGSAGPPPTTAPPTTTTTAPPTTTTTSTTSTTTTTATTVPPTTRALRTEEASATDAGSSGGGLGAATIILVVLTAAAIAGGAVVVRRRTRTGAGG